MATQQLEKVHNTDSAYRVEKDNQQVEQQQQQQQKQDIQILQSRSQSQPKSQSQSRSQSQTRKKSYVYSYKSRNWTTKTQFCTEIYFINNTKFKGFINNQIYILTDLSSFTMYPIRTIGDCLVWNDGTKTAFEDFGKIDINDLNFLNGKSVLFDFIIN